jgi:LacI family transcriptional regulator
MQEDVNRDQFLDIVTNMKKTKHPSRAATIHDVAKRAGVSSMTASRVVSGSVPVTQALRDKVTSAIKELNYRPNVAARAARSGSVRIGIVLTNPKSTILGEFLLGAYGEGTRLGVHLLVEPAIEQPARLDALKRPRSGIPPPPCRCWIRPAFRRSRSRRPNPGRAFRRSRSTISAVPRS